MLLFPQHMTQNPRAPDLEAQRVAMGRLSFLAGEWIGRASIQRGPSAPTELVQTENVQYKLDGLVLMIEGVGRASSDGQPVLQALGLISYDDQRMVYQMRAFNEGRFLEAEVKLSEHGKSMTWGFTLGDIRTNPFCEWTKTANGRNFTKSLSVHNLRKGLWRSPSADRNSCMNLAPSRNRH
jgi:hypothetical protein